MIYAVWFGLNIFSLLVLLMIRQRVAEGLRRQIYVLGVGNVVGIKNVFIFFTIFYILAALSIMFFSYLWI